MTLMMSPTPGISAFPDADGNMLHWTATIIGPKETPYADLNLKLSFEFPANYPYSAPTVLFKTPIYHPNIDFSGRICLDILKDKWSAVYNVQTVLLSLQSLLGEPNKFVMAPVWRDDSANNPAAPVHSTMKQRNCTRRTPLNIKGRFWHDTKISTTRLHANMIP